MSQAFTRSEEAAFLQFCQEVRALDKAFEGLSLEVLRLNFERYQEAESLHQEDQQEPYGLANWIFDQQQGYAEAAACANGNW